MLYGHRSRRGARLRSGPVLGHAVGGLLPSAMGVALSPLPVVAVILILGAPRARANGLAFAGGWVAGLVAVSTVVLALAQGAGTPGSASSDGTRWGTLALGVVMLAMAGRQWRRRPVPAAAAVAREGLGAGGDAAAVAVFVVVGSLTVAGSVVWSLVAGQRAAGPLATVRGFMADHNAAIMTVVLLVLGAKLVGNGIAG